MSFNGPAVAEQVFNLVKNSGIKSFTMCATRLRITLNDYSNLDLVKLNAIDGVINAVVADDHLQIVIGMGDIIDVYAAFQKLAS